MTNLHNQHQRVTVSQRTSITNIDNLRRTINVRTLREPLHTGILTQYLPKTNNIQSLTYLVQDGGERWLKLWRR